MLQEKKQIVTNAVLGWGIVLCPLFLFLAGFIEGFTGTIQMGGGITFIVSLILVVCAIWGGIRLIKS